ncbi:MAG TPA: hypothetical protein EYN89_06625 [Flavobacteriales bacterium]|nr:hypothetical protein [Flavobacteriales bacterium]
MKHLTLIIFLWFYSLSTLQAQSCVPFSDDNIISTAADGASSVYAADVDGDGDMDVLSNSSGVSCNFTWYENDGNQNFAAHYIPGGSNFE